MHPEFAAGTLGRVAPDGLVLVNSTVCAVPFDVDAQVVEIPATDIAVEVGNIMAASMVMAGAYAAITRLVAQRPLVDAVSALLPTYRSQHIELNTRALAAGFAAAAATSTAARR